MQKKQLKKAISLVMAFALLSTGVVTSNQAQAAASKAKLKTKSIAVKVGKTKKITVTGKVKKAKYIFKSSKKTIATVSSKGIVKGVKAGNAIITVKEKKNKKVRTVGKVNVTVQKNNDNKKPDNTKTPVVTPTTVPSSVPDSTPEATATAAAKTPAPTATPEIEINTDGITQAMKEPGNNNPIAAQRFMADPYAIEYEGRVYVYGTNDSQQMRIDEDGKIPSNNYSNINTLNCYSSEDMVNWRDEGIIQVAGKKGPATWAKNSWAPAVAYKKIDGKDKFFIYFADNGSGIGVLEGDSPTGPWHDPLGKQLISRSTPNCSDVPWLFDPAVLVDDDGQGYLYFGGIGGSEDREHPECIRVVKLGDDMISLKGEPEVIDAPAPFEDSGINKIGDKYYYSYCTNWDGAKKRPNTSDLGAANIAYMVSDSPMGPWSEAKVVMKNPTSYFSGLPSNDNNNNHHCMLVRRDKIYMFYHSQKMAADMDITQGYRTTGVDYVTIDENGDLKADMTVKGVSQVGIFNPYDVVEAETFAWSDGTSTIVGPQQNNTRNNRVLSSIRKNDYVGLEGVDFGSDGAQSVAMMIASETGEKVEGNVAVYIDSISSANKVGDIAVSADKDYKYMSAKLSKKVTGTHRLFFKFEVKGILVDTWMFSKETEPAVPAE